MSNPCFELWLVLHFQDQRAHIERGKLRTACRKHMPGYVKSPPCDQLMPLLAHADRRARELHKFNTKNNKPGANPSTNVFELVAEIRSHGQRRGEPA